MDNTKAAPPCQHSLKALCDRLGVPYSATLAKIDRCPNPIADEHQPEAGREIVVRKDESGR